MTSRKWCALPQSSLANQIARELVTRLHDGSLVQQALALFPQQIRRKHYAPWRDASLVNGYAGLAVLDAYLDTCFPGEGWDHPGHRYLEFAADDLQRSFTDPGRSQFEVLSLSVGLCGAAFAAWLLSRSGTRYQNLLTTFDQEIIQHTHEHLRQVAAEQHGFASSAYDLISGLTGVGTYLLSHREHALVKPTLHGLIQQLISMSEEANGLPHWYTPVHRIEQPSWKPLYPSGLLNCGLAHGIAGPLALLSLAKLHGEEVDGQREGIERMASWLSKHRCDDEWGVNWGMVYPADEHGASAEPAQSAWCYGAPGIARALWLAGEAVQCDAYRHLAIAAMDAVYRKPVPQRWIDGPSLCHGVAGLLQITLRFRYDTQLPLFHEAAQTLVEQLFSLYEPKSLLGYRDCEHDARIDRPSLLTGTTGIALTLLAASQEQEPTWDRLLLLS